MTTEAEAPRPILLESPTWIESIVPARHAVAGDDAAMRLAIDLARENVVRRAGGPFGAVVFEEGTGRILGAGVNGVERLRNSVLHAEMVALMAAEARVGSHTLRRAGGPARVLATSCDPCAMCLGAALWSGIGRLVCGAGRDDAARLGFEEGPVFAASWEYVEKRGLRVRRGLLAGQARAVLEEYRVAGGAIYNG
jgi:tRNA(Arg) A34 adenosine deaminase TadA